MSISTLPDKMTSFLRCMLVVTVVVLVRYTEAEITFYYPEGGTGTMVIPEDTPLGAEIAVLNSSAVIYLMVDPPDPLQFELDIDGTFSVAMTATLDYEIKTLHELKYKVTGGGEIAYGTIYVSLTDANDNIPVFYQPIFAFRVIHGSGEGTYVGIANASDADVTNDVGRYEFTNETNPNGTFMVNATGHVFIGEGTLLSHIRKSYRLEIIATDDADTPLQGTAVVIIAVCGGSASGSPALQVDKLTLILAIFLSALYQLTRIHELSSLN